MHIRIYAAAGVFALIRRVCQVQRAPVFVKHSDLSTEKHLGKTGLVFRVEQL